MPATPADARDLLIASVLCDDPVLYVDDRWLYDQRAPLEPARPYDLREIQPARTHEGDAATVVAAGFSAQLALDAVRRLMAQDIACDAWDLRVINPLRLEDIYASVRRTGRLCVIDGGWRSCGLAGEVIANVAESLDAGAFKRAPLRITLPDAPAPTSAALEKLYYPTVDEVVRGIRALLD